MGFGTAWLERQVFCLCVCICGSACQCVLNVDRSSLAGGKGVAWDFLFISVLLHILCCIFCLLCLLSCVQGEKLNTTKHQSLWEPWPLNHCQPSDCCRLLLAQTQMCRQKHCKIGGKMHSWEGMRRQANVWAFASIPHNMWRDTSKRLTHCQTPPGWLWLVLEIFSARNAGSWYTEMLENTALTRTHWDRNERRRGSGGWCFYLYLAGS